MHSQNRGRIWLATIQLLCTVKNTLLFRHRLLKMFSYWWQTVSSESKRMALCKPSDDYQDGPQSCVSENDMGHSRGTLRCISREWWFIIKGFKAMADRQIDSCMAGALKRVPQGDRQHGRGSEWKNSAPVWQEEASVLRLFRDRRGFRSLQAGFPTARQESGKGVELRPVVTNTPFDINLLLGRRS